MELHLWPRLVWKQEIMLVYFCYFALHVLSVVYLLFHI
jgi:hypothetical protein